MNIFRVIGVSTAALLAFGTATYAADANNAYAPTAFDWSGPYLGVQLGYGAGQAEIDLGAKLSFDADGFVAGGFAGWNFQNGIFVYGLETDFNYSGVEGDLAPFAPGVDIGFDWYGSTRARVGLAIDRFLPFATAGVAYSSASVKGPGIDESETSIGWTVGAGLEYAFTDNLVGRAEYRYHDFGSKDWGIGTDIKTKLHTTTVGISYKF